MNYLPAKKILKGFLFIHRSFSVTSATKFLLGTVLILALHVQAKEPFHIPPTGRFTIADGENWVALGIYVAVTIAVSSIAEAARARAAEGEQRRREADLGAELARLLLGAAKLTRSAPRPSASPPRSTCRRRRSPPKAIL